MRIKHLAVSLAIIAAIGATTTISGCSPSQTLDRANDFRTVADQSASIAAKIRNALGKYNAGVIEESILVDMVMAWLPENRQVLFQSWLDIGTEARVAAEDMASALEVTAADSTTQYNTLIAQAESEQGKWDNFTSILGSVASVALQPEGAVIGGLGILAALFRKREKKAVAVAREASDAGVRMKDVATNIVHSIEALNATTAGFQSWSDGGSDVVKAVQSDDAIEFVKSITKPSK